MKMEICRDGIKITPEGPQDEVYLETVLGLDDRASKCELHRRNSLVGDWMFAETRNVRQPEVMLAPDMARIMADRVGVVSAVDQEMCALVCKAAELLVRDLRGTEVSEELLTAVKNTDTADVLRALYMMWAGTDSAQFRTLEPVFGRFVTANADASINHTRLAMLMLPIMASWDTAGGKTRFIEMLRSFDEQEAWVK